MRESGNKETGIVLLSTIFMLAVIATMIATFYKVSKIEIASTYSNRQSVSGFYSAEAGLNIRASEIKEKFDGFNVPTGASPTSSSPCQGGDNGSGDFACKTHTLNNQTVTTYMIEEPSNPKIINIPNGELYQTLNAIENVYTVQSVATDKNNKTTSQLELGFKSRLIPLFQFFIFYNKDLELHPGPTMVTAGPIHANGDIYIAPATGGIYMNSRISTSGEFRIGYKANPDSCPTVPSHYNDEIYFPDPLVTNPVVPGDYVPYDDCTEPNPTAPRPQSELDGLNGMIKINTPVVEVPEVEEFDPTSGKHFWDKADLRLVLPLDSANNSITSVYPTGVEVHRADKTVDVAATTALQGCSGSLDGSTKAVFNTAGPTYSPPFYDLRESPTGTQASKLLEVDMQALLNCLHSTNFLGSGIGLDDTTDNGLAIFLTVKGPNSTSSQSFYGFRIHNASELQSTLPSAPEVKGLSIISDHAAYTKGNYNSVNKIPAAIMADAYTVLSSSWDDANSNNYFDFRLADHTTINTAVISGTDTTGADDFGWGEGSPCAPCDNHGEFSNGGAGSFLRMLEAWHYHADHFDNTTPPPGWGPPGNGKKTLYYNGSFVSLGNSRRSSGRWIYGTSNSAYSHVPTNYRGQYMPPTRDWKYDVDFNLIENLPPLTPRATYLKQELFIRDYDQ